jgi:uncharacterized protein (DUF849 family)
MLQQIEELGEEAGGMKVLLSEVAHLPWEKDLIASEKALSKAFADRDRIIATHTAKLLSMSRRLYQDRESVKAILDLVEETLTRWEAWLNLSEDEATDEMLQDHLILVSQVMMALREEMNVYEAGVLARLKEER